MDDTRLPGAGSRSAGRGTLDVIGVIAHAQGAQGSVRLVLFLELEWGKLSSQFTRSYNDRHEKCSSDHRIPELSWGRIVVVVPVPGRKKTPSSSSSGPGIIDCRSLIAR
jgi:hypothetical protein